MKEYIGLDLGTSNLKGVLIRGNTIAAAEARSNSFLYPQKDHVEIDPQGYINLVMDLIHALAQKSLSPVKGICACAASGNTLLMDKNKVPCTNIISWLDQRKVTLPSFSREMIHETVGWPLISTFPLVHLQYFKDRDMLAGKTVGMSNDFVNLHLTGKHVLDFSSGTPFYLIDQKKRCYCQEILAQYDLSEEALPLLAESGSVIGPVSESLRTGKLTEETLVYSGSFDHPSAARAVDLLQDDEILLSCGSSWVVFEAVKERKVVPGTLADPYLSGSSGPWGRMRSLAKAGLALEEFICSSFGSGQDRYRSFRENIQRSDVQSCVKDLAERFAAILPEKKIRTIYMVGGAAKDEICPSMIAKICNCTVKVPQFHLYAGSVGSARMAGAEKVPLECHVFNP